jgi:hypothetical protein
MGAFLLHWQVFGGGWKPFSKAGGALVLTEKESKGLFFADSGPDLHKTP